MLSGAGAWRNVITALTTYFDVTYHVCKNGGLQWQVVGSEIQLYILTLTFCLFSFEIIFYVFLNAVRLNDMWQLMLPHVIE